MAGKMKKSTAKEGVQAAKMSKVAQGKKNPKSKAKKTLKKSLTNSSKKKGKSGY